MKKFFTLLVTTDDTTKLEKLMNTFRIGLNEWDKTKVFMIDGVGFVNYTILCEEELFTSIVNQMNATRVY